jgi:hypothetical protein
MREEKKRAKPADPGGIFKWVGITEARHLTRMTNV